MEKPAKQFTMLEPAEHVLYTCEGRARVQAKDGVIDNNSTAPRGPAPDRTKHEGSSSDCGSPSPHVQAKQ